MTSNFTVLKTREFDKWLKDRETIERIKILARLDMVSLGHFGDHKKFLGLVELRWKSGLRIYSFISEGTIVFVLNGGKKDGQNRDIKKAQRIKKEILEGSYSL